MERLKPIRSSRPPQPIETERERLLREHREREERREVAARVAAEWLFDL